MVLIKKIPANKEVFNHLKELGVKTLDALAEVKVSPIVYGSLSYFGYTQDKESTINDLDFLIPEDSFDSVKMILSKKGIHFDYSAEEHCITVIDGKVKIELDSKEFYFQNLSEKCQNFNFNGLKVRSVSQNDLIDRYRKSALLNLNKSAEYNKKLQGLEKISRK
ncbi:MAG: hypothetical protein ACP5N2_01120 [Candidatus Nanoarchaeia archaeon]